MNSSLLPQVVDDTQGDSEDTGPEEWVSYWKPNITVNLVDDFTRYPHNAVPPNVSPYLNIEPSTGNYFQPFSSTNFESILGRKSLPPGDHNGCFLYFHSVFDFLAFKNDIQFGTKISLWKGLSAKSVL
ncbi:hypothetical protein M0R45_005826 [Rubus argutus]|uniref:Tyrosinase copper-binding domain-containing protein n=1 Tax=Rubus argutus TaxID=59490 RepID=A0AAW1YNW6_RUBAR